MGTALSEPVASILLLLLLLSLGACTGVDATVFESTDFNTAFVKPLAESDTAFPEPEVNKLLLLPLVTGFGLVVTVSVPTEAKNF